MARAISGVGVGVGADEASALGTNVFGVKKVVIPVSKMTAPKRRRLGKRLWSELDAVRDLLRKVELFAPGAPPVEEEEEDDGRRAAKSKNVSPFAKPGDRERLAGRLASMAASLPDHVVAFLQNRRVGDADSRGGNDGEIEMDDAQFMEGGDLFQLKMSLDKFAPEVSTPKLLAPEVSTPKLLLAPEVSTRKSRGGRAPLADSGISCLSQVQHHEAAGGTMPAVQEEEEEDGGVNICGGVSRIAIRDIAEEYGELVDGVEVELLSPLQRKYVDLAEEQDMDVDICGDASPVVLPVPVKTGDGSSSGSSSSSSSDSDATSTDSDSSSSSPEVLLPKENSDCRAGEPVLAAPEADPVQGKHSTPPPEPAPEAIQIAEPENQCAAAMVIAVTKTPPAPGILPKECDTLAQPPEQLENQCAAATVIAVTKSPPAPPAILPEESGALVQPPEQAPEPAATVRPVTGSAPPPPAVLPNENGASSSQPAPAPAPGPSPVAAQIAEPEQQPQEVQGEGAQTTNDLIAMARQEWRRRAMAKAHQKLVEMLKAVVPDQRIHPRDMELLGISAFEHVVSTVRDPGTAQPEVNDGVALSFTPGGPSILQQLGVFLKADDGCEEDEEQAVASDGEEMDMEIEDGQII